MEYSIFIVKQILDIFLLLMKQKSKGGQFNIKIINDLIINEQMVATLQRIIFTKSFDFDNFLFKDKNTNQSIVMLIQIKKNC